MNRELNAFLFVASTLAFAAFVSNEVEHNVVMPGTAVAHAFLVMAAAARLDPRTHCGVLVLNALYVVFALTRTAAPGGREYAGAALALTFAASSPGVGAGVATRAGMKACAVAAFVCASAFDLRPDDDWRLIASACVFWGGALYFASRDDAMTLTDVLCVATAALVSPWRHFGSAYAFIVATALMRL